MDGTSYGLAAATFPNGRVALYITRGLSMYARLGVNVPSADIGPLETFVKTYDENEPFRQPILDSGILEDTSLRAENGFVKLELWRLSAAAAALVRPLLGLNEPSEDEGSDAPPPTLH